MSLDQFWSPLLWVCIFVHQRSNVKRNKVSSDSFRSAQRRIAASCTVDKKLQLPVRLPAFPLFILKSILLFWKPSRKNNTILYFLFNLAITHCRSIGLGNLLAAWGWCRNPWNTAVWVWPHFQSLLHWSSDSQRATLLHSPSSLQSLPVCIWEPWKSSAYNGFAGSVGNRSSCTPAQSSCSFWLTQGSHGGMWNIHIKFSELINTAVPELYSMAWPNYSTSMNTQHLHQYTWEDNLSLNNKKPFYDKL